MSSTYWRAFYQEQSACPYELHTFVTTGTQHMVIKGWGTVLYVVFDRLRQKAATCCLLFSSVWEGGLLKMAAINALQASLRTINRAAYLNEEFLVNMGCADLS